MYFTISHISILRGNCTVYSICLIYFFIELTSSYAQNTLEFKSEWIQVAKLATYYSYLKKKEKEKERDILQTANFINATLYVHKIDFHHAYIDLSGYKEILQSLFDFQHDLKTTRRDLFKSSVTFKSIAWIMDLAEIGRQRQIFVYTSFFNPLISFWSRKILNTRNMKIGPLKLQSFVCKWKL